MSNELILIKLTTSEEIIASVIEEDDEKYVLEKPRLCAMQQGQDAQGNTGNYLVLLPWIMYAFDPENKSERDVELYKSSIAGKAVSVPKVLEDEYLHSTSGIQIATAK